MKIRYVLALLILTATACTKKSNQGESGIDQRIDSLLNLMTLEEKIGQMNLLTSDYDVTGPTFRENYKSDIKEGKVGAVFNAFGADYTRKLQEIAVKETRLHIPLIFGYDVIHGHRTIFPIPLGLSSSWDLQAIEQSARIAASEASAEGLHWAFGPMVDITRDPRWGRVMEGSGEDTYLGTLIATAMVKGLQGKNIGELNSVMASVKHFAAYGAAQAGRDYHTVDISERVLREVYLPPFKAAVDAGAATVMTSFNEYDGVPATANKFLVNTILRKEWGFSGFVVSDYTSIMELIPHGVATDSSSAAQLALEAGLDMDLQAGFFVDRLPALVKKGIVNETMIDVAVRRILRKKFELGLFDDPYRYCNAEREKSTVMNPGFLEIARDISRKSIVLLKNENQTLPISKATRRIAVIGPLANSRRDMIGAWSAAGDWNKAVSLLEGIKSKVATGTQVAYAKGCNINDDSVKYFAEAIGVARQADVVILAVGESWWMSGEAASRASIDLPGIQERLIEEVRKTGKPVIVVLMNGRPLTLSRIDKSVPAILETWFLGTQAGNAIADVLFGDYNPSGKLTMTFPQSIGQVPLFYNMKNTGRPRDPANKYTSKYLDIDNEPLYPFGYGLGYSRFTYGDVTLDKKEIGHGERLTIKCSVTNTGVRAGEEVVQLYIRDYVGTVTRPVKELKGFSKIMVQPGETKEITFTISDKDLSFYRGDMTFGSEPGKFQVFVGTNSRDGHSADFVLR